MTVLQTTRREVDLGSWFQREFVDACHSIPEGRGQLGTGAGLIAFNDSSLVACLPQPGPEGLMAHSSAGDISESNPN